MPSTVSDLYVEKVCKIGQGAACCRFLVGGPKGFECGKMYPELVAQIEARTDMMAKADNCPGQAGVLGDMTNFDVSTSKFVDAPVRSRQ